MSHVVSEVYLQRGVRVLVSFPFSSANTHIIRLPRALLSIQDTSRTRVREERATEVVTTYGKHTLTVLHQNPPPKLIW